MSESTLGPLLSKVLEQLEHNDPAQAHILMNRDGVVRLLKLAKGHGMDGLTADMAKLIRKGLIALDRSAAAHATGSATGSATAEGDSA